MAAQAVNVTVHELPGRIVAVYCGNCSGALRLALPMPLDELVEAGHAFRARHAACEPKDKPQGPF